MVSNSQRETIVDGSYSNTMMWCFMFAVEVLYTLQYLRDNIFCDPWLRIESKGGLSK
jgi:hypothetical protein